MIKSFMHGLGPVLRGMGKSLDTMGMAMQGAKNAERALPSTANMVYEGSAPQIHASSFVAPNASVIGSVSIGEGSSVMYGAKVRGDVHSITIGKNSFVGDCSMIHVAKIQGDHPTTIGDGVTIGPNAVIHACTIQDNAMIGTGAQVLDGAVVESNAVVAPGATVTPNKTVPSGQLWVGTPAEYLRDLSEEEINSIANTAAESRQLSAAHKTVCEKDYMEYYLDWDEYDEIMSQDPDLEFADDEVDSKYIQPSGGLLSERRAQLN